MAKRKTKDAAVAESSRRRAEGPGAGGEVSAAAGGEQTPRREGTAEDVIRRVCGERGVTAERVLATIVEAMAEDYLHLHSPDAQPLEIPGAVVERVLPALTGLAFRRLMQRLCAENLAAGERQDDDAASNPDWFDAMMAGNRGNAQAAAVDAFDAVSLLTARQVEQAKYEAEVMGEPDPCPHIQFAEGDGVPGSAGRPMVIGPRDRSPAAGGAKGGRAADGTMWN